LHLIVAPRPLAFIKDPNLSFVLLLIRLIAAPLFKIIELVSIWRDWLNAYTPRVSSTSKSLGLIMAETMTGPLGSSYCSVLLDLSFLLLFLELVFDEELLEDPLGAPLDIEFHPLLVSFYLRLF
jgi:hypothetical protein